MTGAARQRETRPLSAAELGRLLLPLLPRPRPAALAVACSGGPDSLCLALLTHEWASLRGIAVTALVVDHGLRPESAAEARQTIARLKQAGLGTALLSWRGRKPRTGRQAAARAARYALLQDWCAANGVGHLLLAHHRDDQAETFLLRAARGSGVDGLAAMAPRRHLEGGIVALRPLLTVPKARLKAALDQRGQRWIDDPSNQDPAYARVRVRRALADLEPEAAGHLAATAANLARAAAALKAAAGDLLARGTAYDPAGYAWAEGAALGAAPDEIALRALARLLGQVGGLPLPPRLDGLERLLAEIRTGLPVARSLHRCQLSMAGDRILVVREPRHSPPPLRLTAGLQDWDGRFTVRVPPQARGLTLRMHGTTDALGQPEAVPMPARASLPALWRGARRLAVPALGFGDLPAGFALIFKPCAGETPSGN